MNIHPSGCRCGFTTWLTYRLAQPPQANFLCYVLLPRADLHFGRCRLSMLRIAVCGTRARLLRVVNGGRSTMSRLPFKVPRKGPAMLPFASRGACALFSGMFCCLELFLRPRNEPRTMTLDLGHGIVLWSAGGVWDAILFLRRYGAGNTTQFTRY